MVEELMIIMMSYTFDAEYILVVENGEIILCVRKFHNWNMIWADRIYCLVRGKSNFTIHIIFSKCQSLY